MVCLNLFIIVRKFKLIFRCALGGAIMNAGMSMAVFGTQGDTRLMLQILISFVATLAMLFFISVLIERRKKINGN